MSNLKKEVTLLPAVSLVNLLSTESLNRSDAKEAFELVFGFEARLVAVEAIRLLLDEALQSETPEYMAESIHNNINTIRELLALSQLF